MSRNPLPSVETISLTDYNNTYGKDMAASFYVINRAPTTWGSADILFNVNGDNGRIIGVIIPASFAPIDLTMFASRESLINCTELRTLLQKGYVMIVDNKSAEEAVKDSRVEKELQRVLNFNRASNMDDSAGKGKVQLGSNGTQYGTTEGSYIEPPYVSELINIAVENQNDPDRVENAFIRLADRLTKDDLDYIIRSNKNTKLTELAIDERG